MFAVVAFADKRLAHSLRRFHRQATRMGVFDRIETLNEDDLSQNFLNEFQHRLDVSPGFGYWVWKPQVILQVMEKLQPGDILLYADAGCHLNRRGVHRLWEYAEIVKSSPTGILGFELSFGRELTHPESSWTKGDLFDFFGIKKDSEFASSPQVCGTVIIFQKRPNVEAFLRQWLDVFRGHFGLVDDSPSSWNFPDFVAHRHDQSVFSLMAKLSGAYLLSHSESYPAKVKSNGRPDWRTLKGFPVLAKRDKLTTVGKVNGLTFRILGQFRWRPRGS